LPWRQKLGVYGEVRAILPYRPLPFLAGIGGQVSPKQAVRLIRKLLMRGNFPITLEKLGRRKINSPSRHQQLDDKEVTVVT